MCLLSISGTQLSYAIMKSTSEDIMEGLWTLHLPYGGRRPFTGMMGGFQKASISDRNSCHPS